MSTRKESRRRDRRRRRADSDSDIKAGPWTDSSNSGAKSEDEAARGFIDDVTADLARVNPTNGISMGLPWEVAVGSRIARSKKDKRRHGTDAARKSDIAAAAANKRGHERGEGDHATRRAAKKPHAHDDKKKRNNKEGAEKAKSHSKNIEAKCALAVKELREWGRKFKTEADDAERAFAALGTREAAEWHRRYKAWLVEWGVASGDCRRAMRQPHPQEVLVTLRSLRGVYATRDAGADALRDLLTATSAAQRRDPNWVRVHHFGGVYVSLARDLETWIAATEACLV
jgi:hypothetical protein